VRAIADVDGDGLGDIVLANKYDDHWSIGSNGPDELCRALGAPQPR